MTNLTTDKEAKTHWRVYITDRGMRPSENNWYRIESTLKPTFDDIRLTQLKLGYDPAGYGEPSNIEYGFTARCYKTTWSSASSCD